MNPAAATAHEQTDPGREQAAPTAEAPALTGGRGARPRILHAAAELFYRQGINATGIEQLAERAHVSKRTLYQHFASKDDLIAAYLAQVAEQHTLPIDRSLDRADVSPRERLLGIFEIPEGFRGCPFLNAAAELCETGHPARQVVRAIKDEQIARLATVAREAGAADPEALGWQLAVLADGSSSQSLALGSDAPARQARAAAAALLDLAGV